MTRRDTIIIAVLINTGLLIALFFSADRNTQTMATMAKSASLPPSTPQVVTPPSFNKVKSSAKKTTKMVPKKKPALVKKSAVAVKPPKDKVETLIKKTAAATTKKKPDPNLVTVQRGDTLEKIARKKKVTISSLMQENDLIDSRLSIGQVLKVPAQTAENQAEYYVVRGGDNPWTIAQKNHIRVSDLLRMNNMDEAKAKRLRPGDKLRIK